MSAPLIRPATPDDEGFIAYSWLRSFEDSEIASACTPHDERLATRCQHCGKWATNRGYSSGEYRHGQRRLIGYLLATSTVLVAEATDVHGGMLDGFACFARGPASPATRLGQGWDPVWVVHFVYTRLSARGQGVAAALLAPVLQDPNVRVTYTHRPVTVDAKRLPRNFKFDHYETFRQLTKGFAT